MDFEDMIQTSQIKAVKAAIPYLDADSAMKMWIIIKLMEIKNIIDFYKNPESRDNMSGFDITKIFSQEAFSTLDQQSRELIEEFLEKAQGKSQFEIMSLLMEYNEKLNSTGTFSEKKKEMLMEAIKQNLNEGERKRFEIIEQMLKSK